MATNKSLEKALREAVLLARADLKYAQQSLRAACDRIQTTMRFVKYALATGSPISELGELQGSGPDFDRLCCNFCAKKDTLELAEKLLAKFKENKQK